MGFVQVLLWVGPLAVVLGVVAGLCLSNTGKKCKPRLDTLSTPEIRTLASTQDDLLVIRSAIRELSERGESLNFIKPRILDMSVNPNSVVSLTANELLKDFFNGPLRGASARHDGNRPNCATSSTDA